MKTDSRNDKKMFANFPKRKAAFYFLIILIVLVQLTFNIKIWKGHLVMAEHISMEAFVSNVDLDSQIKKLPDEMGLSLPVPILERNLGEKRIIDIGFFHFSMRRVGKGRYKISSPRYRSVFAYDTGELQNLKKVRSSDFGINFADDGPIGTYIQPPDLSMAQYNQLKSRLFSLYDLVIPIYERGKPAYTQEEILLIQEFRTLFTSLAHAPLMPYYQALNPGFFNWLETQEYKY